MAKAKKSKSTTTPSKPVKTARKAAKKTPAPIPAQFTIVAVPSKP